MPNPSPGPLAQLQRATTLGALLMAGAWAVGCLLFGHPAWGVAGALLIVGGYAAVLALEFWLLHATHGSDPAPRATGRQLLVAWWGEVRAAPKVFCWRQPFCSTRWPDLLPPAAFGQRGLLLVHGLVCNRGFWNPWLRQLTAQRVPFVAVNLQPVFAGIDDYRQAVEDAVQQLERCTGLPPVVVAHSMGGLVVRRWWVDAPTHAGRLAHVVTLGTPHQGTWLARIGHSASSRQMRQGSAWLQALSALEPPGRAAQFTCLYSHCDNIVFPPSVATLPGADNRLVPGFAHVHLADAPQAWQVVQQRLAMTEESLPQGAR